MKHDERTEEAFRGGRPDRVPIVPIYDIGYIAKAAEVDVRTIMTQGGEFRTKIIEKAFLRHKVDGFFVHRGVNDEWVKNHDIEVFDEYWMITDKKTGKKYRLRSDGYQAKEDGTPILRAQSQKDNISLINNKEDMDKLIPNVPSLSEIEEDCRFKPLESLTQKYPEHHFSFQMASPMVKAINACGGYVEGLTTMAENPALYNEIMERYVPLEQALIVPGKKAGARSVWFTSYYTGADTISPANYANFVFPFEKAVCKKIKEEGLFVLYWFLGDLMPIIDYVMELPIDALVLEQGRKAYDIDPVKIREKVGDDFCIFGFGYEKDYCEFNRESLTKEFIRQFEGAGKNGSFVAGTPIMPPDANPEAVDFYFDLAMKYGIYK